MVNRGHRTIVVIAGPNAASTSRAPIDAKKSKNK
jgi:hypothetical protein